MYTRWKGEISAPKARCDAPNTDICPPTREEHMNSYLAIRVGCPTRIPLRPQHSKFFSIAL